MRRGFSLIELVLVMSLLTIIAILLISYTGDVGNVSVDAASWKIASDIRHAQQLATTTGVDHGVQFNANGTYTVYRETLATPATDPLDRGPMQENVAQFGSVGLAGSYLVEFDRTGKPVVGGGGFVEIVSESGASRRVYVIENTGAVIVDVLDYGSSCSCRMCALEGV